MTDRATLKALLARVLEGTGPDRELDGEIWRIAEPGSFAPPHGLDCKPWRYIGNGVWRDDSDPEGHNKAFAPNFTASLDATLTLMPEGRDWHVQSNRSVGACWASVSPAKHDLKLREWGSGIVKAATPERALIAACIKARMEGQGE